MRARLFILFALLAIALPMSAVAQTDAKSEWQVGEVTQVKSERQIQVEEQDFYIQELVVKHSKTGELININSGNDYQPLNENQRLGVGAKVIFSNQQVMEGENNWVINDVYRLPQLIFLAVMFGVLVMVVGGKQGSLSILGMFFSLYILAVFIVPKILAGENPFLVVMVGCALTAIITMYMSHGIKRQTHIALGSMLVSLAMVAILSNSAVHAAHMVGLGSEEAAYLQFGTTTKINLQGLLLAGILLGALGILDDITLAQTSVIEQLKAVKPKITFSELYFRGLQVGKDHVASLVNTLVFAYAGTSLPLLLLFSAGSYQPAWVVINSEIVAEEIIRTLVGSIGLVMAVPITTGIASYFVSKAEIKQPNAKTHLHIH